MALPSEYEAYLKANLNWFERLGDVFSGLDERIDYTNTLLTKLIELQGGVAPARPEWLDELISVIRGISVVGIVPNKGTFLTGEATVATARTAVQLTTSSIPVQDGYQLTVIAKPGNSGTIYIGRTKSDAEGAQKFDGLAAALAVSLKVNNVNLVWVNSDTANDGVSWIVEQ